MDKSHTEELTIENILVKYIYRDTKNRKGSEIISRKRIGVMVLFPHPDNPEEVTFGFSLCNPLDKFDSIWKDEFGTVSKTVKNFGRMTAINRAIAWGKKNKTHFIPYKIKKEVDEFIARGERYYQDRKIMKWVKESQLILIKPGSEEYSEE